MKTEAINVFLSAISLEVSNSMTLLSSEFHKALQREEEGEALNSCVLCKFVSLTWLVCALVRVSPAVYKRRDEVIVRI